MEIVKNIAPPPLPPPPPPTYDIFGLTQDELNVLAAVLGRMSNPDFNFRASRYPEAVKANQAGDLIYKMYVKVDDALGGVR